MLGLHAHCWASRKPVYRGMLFSLIEVLLHRSCACIVCRAWMAGSWRPPRPPFASCTWRGCQTSRQACCCQTRLCKSVLVHDGSGAAPQTSRYCLRLLTSCHLCESLINSVPLSFFTCLQQNSHCDIPIRAGFEVILRSAIDRAESLGVEWGPQLDWQCPRDSAGSLSAARPGDAIPDA